MDLFPQFGKVLIVIGAVTAVIGLLMLFGDKIPFIGRLPGDFRFEGKRFTFYFPLATSILVSLILTLLLMLFNRK
jgi:hypothetical protein